MTAVGSHTVYKNTLSISKQILFIYIVLERTLLLVFLLIKIAKLMSYLAPPKLNSYAINTAFWI